jgi:hypothetical protein
LDQRVREPLDAVALPVALAARFPQFRQALASQVRRVR